MIITTQFELGGVEYTMQVNEPKEIDTLHKAIVLSNPPRKCNVCGAQGGTVLDTNKDKEGNTYVNVSCTCGAKAKLGQYKVGGYFWHEFEKYVKDAQSTATAEKPADSTDLPF